MKILSPAGNMQSLKMAIFNGADEVYLGINSFNARNNIDGFTLDNLQEAIDFAHVFGVKVLLAINILFADNELQSALDTAVTAYNKGIDALIIQDLGLAYLLHKYYPQIELHASTQMGLHNLEGVNAILPLGFKRVVLARETPLAEIKRIKQNANVEIEYFAQGALCVSFSGNCYLSSYLNNASGNRGKCKQLCRLRYTLYNGNKKLKDGYLLSAKDFNMINRLPDLKEAGVHVIKIEGRARRPYYVAVATKQYYNAINKLPNVAEHLQLAFNRQYTDGYFSGNGNIISPYSAHIGIFVGKVEKFVKGKNFNEVYFSSNRPLSPKSTFKFFDNSTEKATISAFDLQEISKGKYKLTTTNVVKPGYTVNLIIDAFHEEQVLNQIVKRPVDINISAQIDKPIAAHILLNNKKLEICGDICQKANKQPLTKQEIIKNFAKSEIFDAQIAFNSFDNIFLSKQQLNSFRRKVFDQIYKELVQQHKQLALIQISPSQSVQLFVDYQIVENIQAKFSAKNIIYSPDEYNVDNINKFLEKCSKLNKIAYLDTPNFALKKDIEMLKNIINTTNIGIVANNYYALNLTNNFVVGAALNVFNSVSANVLNKPVISAESIAFSQTKYPYMTLRHCPLKSHINASCAKCPYNKDFKYVMQSGKELKLKRKKLSSCTFYLTD